MMRRLCAGGRVSAAVKKLGTDASAAQTAAASVTKETTTRDAAADSTDFSGGFSVLPVKVKTKKYCCEIGP